jgi:hypothetical protein
VQAAAERTLRGKREGVVPVAALRENLPQRLLKMPAMSLSKGCSSELFRRTLAVHRIRNRLRNLQSNPGRWHLAYNCKGLSRQSTQRLAAASEVSRCN